MKTLRTLTLLAVVLAVIAPSAMGANIYWANPAEGNYAWAGGPWTDNVTATGLPLPWPAAAAPVDGDNIYLVPSVKISNVNYAVSAAHCSIDVAGAMLNLPNSSMGFGYGGRRWSFYDSATLTPNADPMANPTDFNLGAFASLEAASAASTQTLTLKNMDWSKSGDPYFFMPVVVTGSMKNPENGPLHFYGPATIGIDDEPRNAGWTADLYYHGDATITTKNVPARADSGEDTWFSGVTNIGTVNQLGGRMFFEASSSGTIGTLNMTNNAELHINTTALTITDSSGWAGGTIIAGADGVLAAFGRCADDPRRGYVERRGPAGRLARHDDRLCRRRSCR